MTTPQPAPVRTTIISTRHIEPAPSQAAPALAGFDVDLAEAIEQGRISLRRAEALQAARVTPTALPPARLKGQCDDGIG